MPFNMPGGPEVMVILLVALIVLGPEQLPKAMRTFGNVMAEIRKLSNGFQAEMRQAMNQVEQATSMPTGSSSSSSSSGSGGSAAAPAAAIGAGEVGSGANGSGDGHAPTAAATGAGTDGSSAGSEVVVRHPAPQARADGPAISPADRAAG